MLAPNQIYQVSYRLILTQGSGPDFPLRVGLALNGTDVGEGTPALVVPLGEFTSVNNTEIVNTGPSGTQELVLRNNSEEGVVLRPVDGTITVLKLK